MNRSTPPRVFISYRHESRAHAARVLALADRLRDEGVDAQIDVYTPWPSGGWRAWMREQLRCSTWVLCVGSPEYRLAAEGRSSGHAARGSAFEGSLIDQELYDGHGQNTRFVPVLFPDQSDADLPDYLVRYRQFRLDVEYDALYCLITDQAPGAPPLGDLRVVPAAVRGVGARPAGVADPAVVAWLRWVGSHFDALPTFDSDRETALTELYVSLAGTDVGGHSRHLLDDLIRRTPKGRWTLQGDPGGGKSTLLRHLAVTVAREAAAALADGRDPGPASIPVLVNLAELPGRGALLDRITARVLEDYSRTERGVPGVRAALQDLLHGDRALVLLDGLDEVEPARRALLIQEVRELARVRPDCGFVVASRRFGYERPDARFREIELLPLVYEEQRTLLTRILGDTEADARLGEISGVPSLQDLATNPFTLTLLGRLALSGGPLPRRRVQVYQRILDGMVGRSLSAQRPPNPTRTRRDLQDLSLTLMDGSGGPWTVAELGARAHADVLETAQETRILVPMPGGRWRFAHRTLMECLAAEGIARRGVPAHVQILQGGRWWKPWTPPRAPDLGRWSEVYAMVAGLDHNPGQCLAELSKWSPDLARRAALGVDNLSMESIQTLWGTDRPATLIRELIQRVPDRDALGRALLHVGCDTQDADTRHYAAAALLALDRLEELRELQRRQREQVGVGDRPWVDVSAGSFSMGSPPETGDDDERPRHLVHISRSLRVLATPVTQALYEVLTGTNPSRFRGDLRRPVEGVTWHEAIAFCGSWARLHGRAPFNPASMDLGLGPRLPTEAEWEYLCRAGTDTCWSFGNGIHLTDHGWFTENSDHTTHPVAAKCPNSAGLYDLHGNVWEWTLDNWRRTYTAATVTDPLHLLTSDGGRRVFRGGAWNDRAVWCRSAYRSGLGDGNSFGWLGFRVVLPAASEG